METEIIVAPRRDQAELVAQNQAIIDLKSQVFKAELHYGEPYKGAGRPTLLKPGAELLCSMFGLRPRFVERTCIEDWSKPLFHYRYECELVDIQTGRVVGAGIGSCNSMEEKYGYRWVKEHEVPAELDKGQLKKRGGVQSEFVFAINESKTDGQYGKPAEYWAKFKDAIAGMQARSIKKTTKAGKTMDAWEIEAWEYRIVNPDIFSLVNTLDKMGQKRALISATLVATGASAFFTQDVEDFAGYAGRIIDEDGVVIDGKAVVTPEPEPPLPPKPAASAQDPNRAGPPAPRRTPPAQQPAPKAEPEPEVAEVVKAATPAPQTSEDRRIPNGAEVNKPKRRNLRTKEIEALKTFIKAISPEIQAEKGLTAEFHAAGSILKAMKLDDWKQLTIAEDNEAEELAAIRARVQKYVETEHVAPDNVTRELVPPVALPPAVNQ